MSREKAKQRQFSYGSEGRAQFADAIVTSHFLPRGGCAYFGGRTWEDMVWDEAKMGVTICSSACSPPVIPQKLCAPVIPQKLCAAVIPQKSHQRFIASHCFSILPRTFIHRLFLILKPLKSTQSYSLLDKMATPLTPASVDKDILDPVKEEGLNVLMLFFPGALTSPTAYYPLIQLLQSRSSFRIWCVALDPSKKYLAEKMIEASIAGMIQRAKQRGFIPGELSISNVFFAGHRLLFSIYEKQAFSVMLYSNPNDRGVNSCHIRNS